MSILAGKVTSVTGMVQAKNPITGEIRLLKEGDEVFLGDVILTSINGGITVSLENGDMLTLGRDTQMSMDEDVVGAPGMTDPVTEAAVDVEALQLAVLEGNFEGLEETAAGGETGGDGSANAGATNTVDRIGAEGEVTSGFNTSTANATFVEEQQAANIPPEVIAEEAEVFEDSIITGQIEFSDENPDTVSVAFAEGTEIPEGLTLNPDGSYSFDANSYDSLNVDDTLEFVLPIVLTDGDGATTDSTLTIRVIGINDIPTADGDAGLVIEAGNLDDGTVVAGQPEITGAIAADDVDNGAVLSYSGSTDSPYGEFIIDSESGEWRYVLDNEAANSLAEGEFETETFIVTVTDEHGASVEEEVIITIQGTNDSPNADDAVFSSDNNTVDINVASFVTDVEDDRDVSDAMSSNIEITKLPEFGTLYVLEGGVLTVLNVGDVVSKEADLQYVADETRSVLFNAERDIENAGFVNGVNYTYETSKGVILGGGTFAGDKPVDGATTEAYLYYGGGDNNNGLGVGDDEELNSDNKEYISFKFPELTEESLVTLGSIYGHYRDVAAHADAQVRIMALKDGEIVSDLTYNDAHNGPTGRGGTGDFDALVSVDGGYDEIRIFTEAGYNSDMTLEEVVVINMEVEDTFEYNAVDTVDAYEPAVVSLNAVIESSIDYYTLLDDDIYEVNQVGDVATVLGFAAGDTLDLSELMDDTVTTSNLDQYLRLGYVDEDGDGTDDSTVMMVDSNGDQAGGDISYVYIQGVVDDEWNINADTDTQGNFDLDD